MKKLLTISLFIFSIFSFSQDNTIISNLENLIDNPVDSIKSKYFKFDISKLQFFNEKNDTIVLDTSLTIKNYYSFNFLKKDNFHLLKSNNVGRFYNTLTYEIQKGNLPKLGYSANDVMLIQREDVLFSKVAYPLTELFFKSVYSQGQLTDAYFTSNLNENLNFSLAFKALRSLGTFQNSLFGSKQFRTTLNYNGEKIVTKFFYLSQSFERNENGGLTSASIENYESEDPIFDERSKLNVKFEDAKNNYQQRIFYLKNNFMLSNKKNNSFDLYHVFDFETSNNRYTQDNPSFYYGSLASGINEIVDHYKLRTLSNSFGLSKDNLFFERLLLQLNNYNLNYFKVDNNIDNKVLSKNFTSFSVKAFKKIFNYDLSIDLEQKINGDQLGNNFIAKVKRKFSENNSFSLSISVKQKHPGLIYENFTSNYENINWIQSMKLVENKSVDLKISNSTLGDIDLNHSIIDDFFYVSVDSNSQEIMAPILNHYDRKIQYSSLRIKRSLNFGKWTIDNSIMCQVVNQNDKILNLPQFISRNTLYFKERIFKNTLSIQTGINFKIFSKFYANEYNPLLSAFHIQSQKKIGGFPLFDFFFNAKIRQTKIFIIAEHINSSLSGNSFYSTPESVYRDFGVRFGFKWNLFN